ncbi:MAG: ATPase, T2SS/T4P/T4SS family [Endomicrobiales bacterium]|jgi:type IV pilus assembly protein PilB
MHANNLKKRLGDILVDVGVISTGQLAAALDIQKRCGGKLGTILAQMGVINEEVMLAFLGKQCGASYVSLVEFGSIPDEIIHCIPESVVRYQSLIPIAKEGNTLTVAMSDPFNVFALDDIKLMTGFDVQVVISAETEIKDAISRYYTHTEKGVHANLIPVDMPDAGIQPEQENEYFKTFLSNVLQTKAALVYLDPQADMIRVRCRQDGFLQEKTPLKKQAMESILPRLKTMAHLVAGVKNVPQEGRIHSRIDEQDRDIHVSIIPSIYGERVVLRISDPESFHRELACLGFEPETINMYRQYIEASKGLIVISGPLNAGKTTTLYSSLYHLNSPNRDIITIENSVEHIIPGVTQVQMHSCSPGELNKDLQIFLQQNPDVIMISELTDLETARCASKAALSGHLVLSAITANSAVETVSYLSNVGLDPFLVASSLSLVVNQRTVRLICPSCKESYNLQRANLRGLGITNKLPGDSQTISLWRGKGCDHCNHTGYQGRTGVFEVLEMNDHFRSLVLERASENALREAALSGGMLTLQEAVWRKVQAGETTAEEMLRTIKS